MLFRSKYGIKYKSLLKCSKIITLYVKINIINTPSVGFGGFTVMCSLRGLGFAGVNPVEVMDFLGRKNTQFLRESIKLWLPSLRFAGTLKNLKPEKNRPLRKMKSALGTPSNNIFPI